MLFYLINVGILAQCIRYHDENGFPLILDSQALS